MPKISVIIPCYNHGNYIEEAVDSVLAQTFKDFEIIIVDDGSTDERTIALFKDYKKPKTTIIHTSNQGLAEARNVGIRNSSGKYILPLDADDKISPEYLADASEVLDADDKIKIVYCDAEWFGDKTGPIQLIPFSMQRMLIDNTIFCSAFFRRQDYDATKGYNKNLYFWEDWDFWLSLLETPGHVHKIPKVRFYYRFRKDSMARTISPRAVEYFYKHAFLRHIELYAREFYDPINLYHEKEKYRQMVSDIKRKSREYKLGRSILTPLRKLGGVFSGIKKIVWPFTGARKEEPITSVYPPIAYHFLMTNYCNVRCIFCNQRSDGQPRQEISFEKFKAMVSNIPVAAAEQFHFTGGGEPLLARDLMPIIKYVNESFPWINIIIRTNGLLIKQYAKELARLNIFRLEISIHGTSEINDIIVQRKDSQTIFDGVAMLKNYLKEYNKKIHIQFVPAVSMLNINDLPYLVKKAGELKIDDIYVYFCRYFSDEAYKPHRLLKQNDSLFFHKWKYDTMIRKSRKLARALSVNFSYDPLFFKRFLKRVQPFCCQPWQLMLIDWDGDVYPCCGGEEWFKAKVKSGEYHFGNLLKENVHQCWNGSAYGMIRKTCRPGSKEKPIAECKDCHSTLYFKGPHVKNAHIIRKK